MERNFYSGDENPADQRMMRVYEKLLGTHALSESGEQQPDDTNFNLLRFQAFLPGGVYDRSLNEEARKQPFTIPRMYGIEPGDDIRHIKSIQEVLHDVAGLVAAEESNYKVPYAVVLKHLQDISRLSQHHDTTKDEVDAEIAALLALIINSDGEDTLANLLNRALEMPAEKSAERNRLLRKALSIYVLPIFKKMVRQLGYDPYDLLVDPPIES